MNNLKVGDKVFVNCDPMGEFGFIEKIEENTITVRQKLYRSGVMTKRENSIRTYSAKVVFPAKEYAETAIVKAVEKLNKCVKNLKEFC